MNQYSLNAFLHMAYRRSALMEERLANNRDRILLAARRLVAKGGFREVFISAVAAVAGLSTGALLTVISRPRPPFVASTRRSTARWRCCGK